MFKNLGFKSAVVIKVIQIILFKIALTDGIPVGYYFKQRNVSFVLFIVLMVNAGRDNKYFSFIIATFGAILFNPFYGTDFSGSGFDLMEWVLIGVIMLWLFFDYYYFYYSPVKGRGILAALKIDKISGKYKILDASVVYEIDPSLVEELREYLKRSNIGSMRNWYFKLSQEDKVKVKRASKYGGALEEENEEKGD